MMGIKEENALTMFIKQFTNWYLIGQQNKILQIYKTLKLINEIF